MGCYVEKRINSSASRQRPKFSTSPVISLLSVLAQQIAPDRSVQRSRYFVGAISRVVDLDARVFIEFDTKSLECINYRQNRRFVPRITHGPRKENITDRVFPRQQRKSIPVVPYSKQEDRENGSNYNDAMEGASADNEDRSYGHAGHDRDGRKGKRDPTKEKPFLRDHVDHRTRQGDSEPNTVSLILFGYPANAFGVRAAEDVRGVPRQRRKRDVVATMRRYFVAADIAQTVDVTITNSEAIRLPICLVESKSHTSLA
jgi:hypothetical protein